ncbi:PAP fibrillin [Synechococcus sp. ATX 2A4]|uniref:PAP/fibrillin family protein n=1 Tax=Synechococcus sp. ATX 2A4 TaxID=2823727 RepID=UPI0020CD2B37|nr:PAP/fibrillin family protein [Synechococcus sp. ATX 2A4]MCP9884266.1 PAP fibrillin [Synechococcus sp. ATX 2A4]
MPFREQLLDALERPGCLSDDSLLTLIKGLEQEAPADLGRQLEQLTGVWELRWSSSKLPYLKVAAWLENLQVLVPQRAQAMNLLRLAGPLGPLAAIGVQARIAVTGGQRVSVTFERGGWRGPELAGRRLELFRAVQQGFPAWLDVTFLDDRLRISRGNAGTVFALVRRPDLDPDMFLGAPATEAEATSGPSQ